MEEAVFFPIYESTDEHYFSLEYDKVHLQVSLSPVLSTLLPSPLLLSSFLFPVYFLFLNLHVGTENTF